MNNRTYGIIGIKALMANWNADFTGKPKSTANGDFFGSDKALKYPMKKMWDNDGHKVIYLKSYKNVDGKLAPKMLEERYAQFFGKLDKTTPSDEVLRNLFSAVDVMNFGATFAVGDQNLSITGAVQIGQGFNKYSDMNVHVQDILSPFQNSKKDDADQSTIGTKTVADRASYFYGFSVNPEHYNTYKAFLGDSFGYSDEAYDLFKSAALTSATAYSTNAKYGCENEFALFIECKDGAKLYLPDLAQYVVYSADAKKATIDVSAVCELIAPFKDSIENAEVYYNPADTEVICDGGLVRKNIYTREVIK